MNIFPILWIDFSLSLLCLYNHKVLLLIKYDLSVMSFVTYTFEIVPKKLMPNPNLWDLLLCFLWVLYLFCFVFIYQFLKLPNLACPYDPAIPPLHIKPTEMQTYVHTKSSTWVFIEALFTISRKQKQRKHHQLINRWVKGSIFIKRNVIQSQKGMTY